MVNSHRWFRRIDVREVEARQSMAGQMISRKQPTRPPVDDVDREPIPDHRPHQRAQWDEAHGRWIEWDEVDHEWDEVEDGAAPPTEGLS